MRWIIGFFGLTIMPHVLAQSIELREVEIVYGDEIIRGQHQVVIDSPDDVTIIPAAKKRELNLGPNVVISSDSRRPSVIERQQIAEREQKIYDEVNRRTEEAPFTILFAGTIPAEIAAKREALMPSVGIFGDQLEKLDNDRAATQAVQVPESMAIDPGERVLGGGASTAQESTPTTSESTTELTNEDLLEQLIGGG